MTQDNPKIKIGPKPGNAVPSAASSAASVTPAYVYVADYGTSQAQVQAAADAASGKNLVFASGVTYTLSSEVWIHANTTVIGQGATLKYPNNSTIDEWQNSALLHYDGSNINLSNMLFDANSANQGGLYSQFRHCVRIDGSISNFVVDNCQFSNLIGDGIFFNFTDNTYGHAEVMNCTFSAANYDGRHAFQWACGDDLYFHNNTCTAITRQDQPSFIDIEPYLPGQISSNIVIDSNTFNGGTNTTMTDRCAIQYFGAQNSADHDISFTNNTVSGTHFTKAIFMKGVADGVNGPAYNLSITGNSVTGIRTGGTAFGINVSDNLVASVTNNTLDGMSHAIYNYHACVTTSGNTITNSANPITHDGPTC